MDWLVGTGELAGRIRAIDWARTPLGPRETWPQSLRTIVNLVVGSRVPMIVLWGTELTTLYNDSCSNIFAQRHPVVLGRPAREVWPDAWHLAEPVAMAVLHRGEAFFREEVRFPLLRHGRLEYAYFNLSDSPIRKEDGSIGGILITFQETTSAVGQRREIERSRQMERETRVKLEAALASMTDAVFISDIDGRFVDFNDAFATFHRFPNKAACARTLAEYPTFLEVFLPDGTPTRLDQWSVSRALSGETVTNAEYTLRRKDTGETWIGSFNFAPIRDSKGNIVGSVVSARDITEQKHAEEALRASEQTYAAIFERAPFALALSSAPAMTFSSVNDAFLQLFECTREDVIGKTSPELNITSEAELEAVRLEFSKNGSVRDFQCTRRAKSGELRHLSLYVDSVNIGGKPHILTTIQDIAAQKEAEEAKRLYQKSKELDELKTRFFANVSHEFRTPLSLILGPVDQSLRDANTPESIRRNLIIIARNARTLLGYVNNLLDVAKLDAGRMKAEAAAVDMVQLVWFVGSHFEALAAENKLVLDIETPTRLVATIDAEKVQRILLNLLSNAFKFTPARGRVRLTLKGTPSHVHIEVADSGPGIPENRRDKIFERFASADPGATGLGLSIAREFTLLHDGTINISDAPEGGALFVVMLPRNVQPDTARQLDAPKKLNLNGDYEQPRQAIEEPAKRRPRSTDPIVLVVEDNTSMNAFIADCLRDQYRVEVAFDGADGLQKALALVPDAILCDMMMPNMTGEEFVREVRRNPALDSTPIVVLTAKHDDEVHVQLLRDGAQDYLTKPFGIEELRIRVGNLIAKRLADNATRLAEAKFRGIVSISADAIIAIDEQHAIVEWNQGAETIFGYSRSEIIGRPIDILLPSRFRAAHHGHLLRFASDPGVARKMSASDVRGLRKSGEEFPFASTISRLEVGGHQLMTVALRDVSEEKRIDAELRTLADFGAALASLDYEKTLHEFVHLAVRSFADFAVLFLCDNDGRLQPIATSSRDPAKAWCTDMILRVPVERPTTSPIWDIIATRKPVSFEISPEMYEVLAPNPEILFALRTAAPRYALGVPLFVGGRLLGALTMASVSRKYDERDFRVIEEIGRQCALFIENARLHDAEKAATRAREEVLGIVAHDLRNPLSVILIEASMLATLDENVDEQTRQSGMAIDFSARRMSRIIRDLLDLVRMEAGSLSIDPSPQAPEPIILAAVETQKTLLAHGSLTLRVECAPDLPHLWMDHDRFLQVFENLIGNAIKFSKSGTLIVVGATGKDDCVLFSVQDQGIGIVETDIPHVFDRFWAGNARTGGGAGLGLTIVKKIVEAHGGRIWVESVLGTGSTFYFELPVVRPYGHPAGG